MKKMIIVLALALGTQVFADTPTSVKAEPVLLSNAARSKLAIKAGLHGLFGLTCGGLVGVGSGVVLFLQIQQLLDEEKRKTYFEKSSPYEVGLTVASLTVAVPCGLFAAYNQFKHAYVKASQAYYGK